MADLDLWLSRDQSHNKVSVTQKNVNEYGQVFQDAGLQIAQSMGLGFNGWWATPLTDSYVVAGNKPATKTAA
ncbi:hypothetical protein SRCM101060_01657 [Lactiplantibacillus plantarum]|uniref:hypothetical protein n=1 Tax=Lactiplantibacillus plantarum TaxID=1590 RepID=UPI0007E997E5|nr:hypothetical protein [Lactiplantibacillus plantarum]AVW08705.1 hypothetical protein DA076_13575 [Lactiplantibacillus plantarum]MCG0723595.1 methyltransferase domain-containing protein [Lactiplantibacillus plantarum]OAZ74835.1 hypothetical protein SRCM101060_01657 [Lactiplantibacillus plantarum]